jgi:hypothetical protein
MSCKRLAPLAVVLLAGCGATKTPNTRDEPPVKPAVSADAAIRDVVLRSYKSTDAKDCAKVYTTSFIQEAFDGVAACVKHVEQLAKLPPRTVSVISVKRDGPVADARIRVDATDWTVKLVLTGRQWQVDDTVGASGSAKQNLAQSRAAAQARAKTGVVHALGTPARFANIAGIGPQVRIEVTPLKIVTRGRVRSGVKTASGTISNDFGTVTNHGVTYRFVNVRVRLTNYGPPRFKGTFAAFLVGANGKRWPAAVHAGRTPDWTDGESKGIPAGRSRTRWLTFAMPAAARPKAIELQPEALSRPDTVMALEPSMARWLAH